MFGIIRSLCSALFFNTVHRRIRFDEVRNSTSTKPKDVLGRAGEDAAVQYLKENGYSILHRNIRFKNGEIDIVARFGATLVFAEVKTRNHRSPKKPYEYVRWKKQQTLRKLARYYILRCGLGNVPLRFDILSVTQLPNWDLEVEHIPNAFHAHHRNRRSRLRS